MGLGSCQNTPVCEQGWHITVAKGMPAAAATWSPCQLGIANRSVVSRDGNHHIQTDTETWPSPAWTHCRENPEVAYWRTPRRGRPQERHLHHGTAASVRRDPSEVRGKHMQAPWGGRQTHLEWPSLLAPSQKAHLSRTESTSQIFASPPMAQRSLHITGMAF